MADILLTESSPHSQTNIFMSPLLLSVKLEVYYYLCHLGDKVLTFLELNCGE